MTDFRFEKSGEKEEGSFQAMKVKLEMIMETLQSQKQQFTKTYQEKIRLYESQLKIKDDLIEELQSKLQISNANLQKMKEESQNYQKVISDLKQQFFKMVSVVNQINLPCPSQQLKRVKSDYIETAFSKIDLNKHFSAASKPQKFDINSYFQNLKATCHTFGNSKVESKQSYELLTSSDDIQSKASIGSGTMRQKWHKNCFDDQTTYKNNEELFQKTLKWGSRKNNQFQRQKQNYVRIREYKQNLWQQTF